MNSTVIGLRSNNPVPLSANVISLDRRKATKPSRIGAIQWHEKALRQPKPQVSAHLLDALQRRNGLWREGEVLLGHVMSPCEREYNHLDVACEWVRFFQ